MEGEVVDGDDGGDDGGDRTPSTRLFSRRRERSHPKKHTTINLSIEMQKNDRRTTPGVLLEEVMDVGTRRAGVCTEMYVFAGHRGSVEHGVRVVREGGVGQRGHEHAGQVYSSCKMDALDFMGMSSAKRGGWREILLILS